MSKALGAMVVGAGLGAFGAGCASQGPAAAPAATPTPHVRVYALDCGRIEITDFGFFTADGRPTGQGRTLVDPCFLIVHPKGKLLWDTGLPEAMHMVKGGIANPAGRAFVDVLLEDQLEELHLAPADITFVGFSHLHADHAGNANLFNGSTWLLARKELEGALHTPTPMGVEPSTFSAYKDARLRLLDADTDLFGDGTVEILQTPGHTPGHQSLEVKLDGGGTVIFTGDLAHSRENWEKHVVPWFNDNHDETIASFGHVEAIAAQTRARIVVQHDADDFDALPRYPAPLE